MTKEISLLERTMTSAEKRKDTMLKKKYDDSDMKKNMQDQYGKEEGKKVYFATIRKQAMKKEEYISEVPALAAIPAAIGKGAAVVGKAALGAAKVTGKVAAKTAQATGKAAGKAAQATGKAAVKGTKAVGKAGLEGLKAGAYAAGETVAGAAGDIAAAKMRKKFGVEEDVQIVNEISSRTLSNYIKKGTKDIAKRASDDESHSGPKYGKKMSRMDGVMKAADKLAKKADQNEEVIPEAKYEAGASTYGKATIRNKRKFGTPGEMPDIMTGKKITKDATRGELIAKRREEHKAKRGVKEEVGISSAVRMKKARDEAMLRLKEKQAVARKMKKEEVEVVNELSKSTLLGYVQKGTRDIATRSSDASIKGMAGKRKEADKGYEKVAKRVAGVNKAAGKLATEAAYTGPDKKDRAVINKMYDKKGNKTDFAKKAAEYEKNMDPKKRQELKDKATKGMKFTHEGTSYGLYKGSGKPGGAMKDYLDKKAKMLTKKRNKQSDAAKNNPHFDSTQPSPSGRNKYEEVQRDGYGDPIGGPKISKKQKAKNLASNTPDEQHTTTTSEAVTFQHFMEKCWKGYEKKGMKTMFGKRYPNCVKKEDVEFTDEGYGSDRVGPALKVARVIDRVNPKPKVGSKRTTISNMLKMASIKKDEKLRKQKENPYSAKKKIKMVVRSISQNARSKAGATKEEYIPEEGYDHWRDKQLERGTWKGGGGRPSVGGGKKLKGKTVLQKETEKKYGKGVSALDVVKKKYGKAVMNVKKK